VNAPAAGSKAASLTQALEKFEHQHQGPEIAAGDADGRVPEVKASAASHELKRFPPAHLSAEQEHKYIEDIEKRWYAQAQTEGTTTTKESLEPAGPALSLSKSLDKFAHEQQAIAGAEREVEKLKALVKSKAFWKRAKGFWKKHHPLATAAEIANEQGNAKARFSKDDERMHVIEEQMMSEVKDPTAINAAVKDIAETPSMQRVLSDLRALASPAKLSPVSPKNQASASASVMMQMHNFTFAKMAKASKLQQTSAATQASGEAISKPCNPGLQLGCNALKASQSGQNINKRQDAQIASVWAVSMRFHLHFASNRSSK